MKCDFMGLYIKNLVFCVSFKKKVTCYVYCVTEIPLISQCQSLYLGVLTFKTLLTVYMGFTMKFDWLLLKI